MGQLIGYQGNGNSNTIGNQARMVRDLAAGYSAIIDENQVLKRIFVRSTSNNADQTVFFDLALYDITDGFGGAPRRVFLEGLTFTPKGVEEHHQIDVDVDLSAFSGQHISMSPNNFSTGTETLRAQSGLVASGEGTRNNDEVELPDPWSGFSADAGYALYIETETAGDPARIAFTEGDPDTRLRDRDGNFITATEVPIRVSTQRDPRGAPALTGAPATMSITDGAATLDLSAADPMPVTGDPVYVEVFSEQATPEDDISRRYVLRMQDGATAGE